MSEICFERFCQLGVALHDNQVPKGASTFHVLHGIAHHTLAAHIGM